MHTLKNYFFLIESLHYTLLIFSSFKNLLSNVTASSFVHNSSETTTHPTPSLRFQRAALYGNFPLGVGGILELQSPMTMDRNFFPRAYLPLVYLLIYYSI